MARCIDPPERNALRAFANNKTLADKAINAQDSEATSLRAAKKYLDNCRRAWDEYDAIINSIIDAAADDDTVDGYNAINEDYQEKVATDLNWLEETERKYHQKVAEKDRNREAAKRTQEANVIKRQMTNISRPIRDKLDLLSQELPDEIQPDVYKVYYNIICTLADKCHKKSEN